MNNKTQIRNSLRCGCSFILVLLILRFATAGELYQAQASMLTPDLREKYLMVLKQVRDDLKDKYYDPNFHGVNIDKSFKDAAEKVKQAQSNGQALGIIAEALLELNDSHTWFEPPNHKLAPDYGWGLRIIGDDCYVTGVKKDSDAEAKGIKPGDKVLNIDGFIPVRDTLWKISYLINRLRPQERLEVVVQSPAGEQRQLTIVAKLLDVPPGREISLDELSQLKAKQRELNISRNKFYEVGSDLIIWKLPHFDLEESDVDNLFKRVEGHKALILDLRGNGGGLITTEQRVLRNLFDHDVKIGDVKNRYASHVDVAKSRGKNAFTGKLIILVDSTSGSASEITARVIQIEKRGLVVGDRSAGAVMESIMVRNRAGLTPALLYGESITIANIIMTDGKSLEHVGVTPDELVLPSPEDLATHRDPVLSRAAALLGVTMDPAKAATIYVEEKKPQ